MPVTSWLRRTALLASVLMPMGVNALPAAADDDPIAVVVTFADGAQRSRLIDRLPAGQRPVGPRAAASRLRAAQVNALRAEPGVVRVEREVVYRALRTPNDPCITSCSGTSQWSIAKINAPLAWEFSLGGSVTIAILDSGVDGTHPDLAGKPVGNEIDRTGGAASNPDHGTSVAGTAAAGTDNGQGIAGLGWQSPILAVKVLDDTGSGLSSWVAGGIYDATDRGAKVINMSLGGPDDSLTVRDAVNYALARGVVVVASMGNAGTTEATYPAAIPGVIGVGATTQADSLASFSNRGAGLDIAAPGVNLPAPVPGGYEAVSGTSFSAPIVSGVAALLLDQGMETAASVQARLQETAVPLAGGLGKRVDAGAALAFARAYPGFPGGARVALGDLTADAGAEVVTGAARGGGPHVRMFTSGYSDRGGFFAYGVGFSGGVDVAAGNIDGAGRDEIITGAGPGGGPHVRMFNADGGLRNDGFFAYGVGFSGGVSVAVGDIDGNGTDEIITGAGPGGGPHVRVFRADGTPLGGGFMAYDPGFTGGVDVAAGDINGDGTDEIITGAGPGGGPHVRIFNGSGSPIGGGFMAYSPAFGGGVRVGALARGGAPTRIVTGPGAGGGPHVRLFTAGGAVVAERFGFPGAFSGGVDVALGPNGPLIGQLSGDTLVRTLLGT